MIVTEVCVCAHEKMAPVCWWVVMHMVCVRVRVRACVFSYLHTCIDMCVLRGQKQGTAERKRERRRERERASTETN